MNQPGTYLWLPAYMSAVLETDNAQMPSRIYEALVAIEQRRPNLTVTDGIEKRAMEDAQTGLLTLKAERVGDANVPELTGVSRAGQQSEGTCLKWSPLKSRIFPSLGLSESLTLIVVPGLVAGNPVFT